MPPFNPYVPTDAIPPKYFAGRKDILTRSEEVFEAARRGIHGGILLTGHRGIGKTSAIRAIEAGLDRSVAVVRIRFSREMSLEQFSSEFIGHIQAELPDWKSKLGITEVKVSFIAVRREPRAEGEASPGVALFRTLRSLRKVGVLWLSLDDMDYIQGDALSMMKSAMEEAGSPTVVLVAAGGPRLRQRFVSEHSPIARFFSGSDFDLNNFSLEETKEALDLPIRSNDIDASWTQAAVSEVHRWTAGYPFLLQCMAYEAFREGRIGKPDVRKAVRGALQRAGTWMEREISRASNEDIRTFDKIARAGQAEWRSAELGQLGINPVYIGRLVKLGVLHKITRGYYELVKPPMIARYHMLRRRLQS